MSKNIAALLGCLIAIIGYFAIIVHRERGLRVLAAGLMIIEYPEILLK